MCDNCSSSRVILPVSVHVGGQNDCLRSQRRPIRPWPETEKGPRKQLSFHQPGGYFFSVVSCSQGPK